MMAYDFKRVEELFWVAIVAAGIFVLTVLVEFDPDAIKDWRTWALSLLGGAVRAAAGALLAYRARSRVA